MPGKQEARPHTIKIPKIIATFSSSKAVKSHSMRGDRVDWERTAAMKRGILTLVVASFLFTSADAHLELKEAARGRRMRTWPCCDRCGGCTKSNPPKCRCQDLVRSCHPSCRSCVRSPLAVDPPLYMCTDLVPNYCHRRCKPDDLLYGQ